MSHRAFKEYECPICGEWLGILATTNKDRFKCTCGEWLRLEVDAECIDGTWHDRSKLVTYRSHWDEKI